MPLKRRTHRYAGDRKVTISQDLVTRYTSEANVDWHEAFILRHPVAGNLYLINFQDEFVGLVDGYPQTFSPVPAQVVPPTRDSNGRQDLSIVWSGVQGQALAYLDEAIADRTQPVECWYTIYIEGNRNPQLDPMMELALTNIAVTETTVTAIATRADILNKVFPSEVYRVDRYPGLRRR